jgi:hypothetical protein
LTKTVKPKLDPSTFLCLQGFFPNSPLEQRGKETLILNYLGKVKERLRIGGKEFLGSTHEGLLVTNAVQVVPAQGQYWSTGNKG